MVPIYDLAIKEDDLVAATHGRSFWILDDITPLRQLTPDGSQHPATLFKPRRTYQDVTSLTFEVRAVPGFKNYQTGAGGGVAFYERRKPDGSTHRSFVDAGDNPTRGVFVTYVLSEQPQGDVTLTFLDAGGHEIGSFTSKQEGESQREGVPRPRVSTERGMNRFVWDMRYPAPTALGDDATVGAFRGPDRGPEAPPGTYQVRLAVNGQTYTETFEIAKDPRVPATREDFDEQFALLIQIRDKLSETNEAILRLRSIRQQVDAWEKRADSRVDVVEATQRLKERLSAIEEELIQTRAKTRSDFLRFPTKLNAKIRALSSVAASTLGTPTQQTYDVFQDLTARISAQVKQVEELIATEVADFNELVRQAGVPAVLPTAPPPGGQQTAS